MVKPHLEKSRRGIHYKNLMIMECSHIGGKPPVPCRCKESHLEVTESLSKPIGGCVIVHFVEMGRKRDTLVENVGYIPHVNCTGYQTPGIQKSSYTKYPAPKGKGPELTLFASQNESSEGPTTVLQTHSPCCVCNRVDLTTDPGRLDECWS